jgi:hypothetical protein
MPVSPTEAATGHLEARPRCGTSRSWRQRPQGQRGSSCSCCPVAVRGGGATKEWPPLRARFSSRSPSGGHAPVSLGHPCRRSPSCPGRDGSGRSDGGHGRKGLQGLLVAAPLLATALPRCRRRRLRRLGLLLASFRDLVTADGGTAEGGHGRTRFGEVRLEARGEVGVCPQPRAHPAFKEER